MSSQALSFPTRIWGMPQCYQQPYIDRAFPPRPRRRVRSPDQPTLTRPSRELSHRVAFQQKMLEQKQEQDRNPVTDATATLGESYPQGCTGRGVGHPRPLPTCGPATLSLTPTDPHPQHKLSPSALQPPPTGSPTALDTPIRPRSSSAPTFQRAKVTIVLKEGDCARKTSRRVLLRPHGGGGWGSGQLCRGLIGPQRLGPLRENKAASIGYLRSLDGA